MENEKIIRTFCGRKVFKKPKSSLIKISLVFIKKRKGAGLPPRYTDNEKVKG